ncbi:ABC transporter substrate-binding protein [Croceicoccus sp. Ery5]|uniref:ABC transporter substrate-binding protein n=1 Tax=Croceicoccus sp. Ery5 TaxID=1703340 RepID=UPI001E339D5F|nr:ABC transporter substrate-binding protein [Croceicoccus sp. Ery5]
MGVSACGGDGEAPVDVVLVGDRAAALSADGSGDAAEAALMAATREGLVDFDAEGRITPGLAESWIVTDDGLSYIFRLREMRDADGSAINARIIRRMLLAAMEQQAKTALGLDLRAVEAVYARTGRVIEIRLKSPFPEFLNLLAGPELSLQTGRRNPHVLVLDTDSSGEPFLLAPAGLEPADNPYAAVEPLEMRILPPREAVEFFQSGRASVLLNGNVDGLPFVRMGGLLRGTIRLDPVSGLFGLAVTRRDSGFLSDADNREAIAMAIDRDALIAPFNIGGWVPTTRLVPAGLPDSASAPQERWQGMSIAERQEVARRRVAGWTAPGEQIPGLTIALPSGRGGDLLFARLRNDFAAIGLTLTRAANPARADLHMVDEVAHVRMARWYLNRFHCGVSGAACSAEGDALVEQALAEPDATARAALMAQAEALIVAENGFIPFGTPIRFSLVRGSVEGFAVNGLGVHPLSQLALNPT